MGIYFSFASGAMLEHHKKYEFQVEIQTHQNGTNEMTELLVLDVEITMETTKIGTMKLYFLYYGTRYQLTENPNNFLPLDAFEIDSLGYEILEEMGLPCHFEIDNGLVEKVFFKEGDEVFSRNIKKSILNLINFKNLSTSYGINETFGKKAFVASEVTFDGQCQVEYHIHQYMNQSVKVTKEIDFIFCSVNTKAFNHLHGNQFTSCDLRTAEMELNLSGNIGNYTFDKAFYKSTCISSEDNIKTKATTVMKMLMISSTRKINHHGLRKHGQFESLTYLDEIPAWYEMSWNRTIVPPTVCDDKTCNWKTTRAVTGVKNQGICNTCYAFSSIAILESFCYNFMTGKKTVLSEQNLQDCLPGTRGKKWKCGGTGGDPKEALSKVRDIGGIYTLKDYPWIQGNARCRKIHKKPAITGREYKVIKEFGVSNDKLMKLVKEFGPVSASVTKKEMLLFKKFPNK